MLGWFLHMVLMDSFMLNVLNVKAPCLFKLVAAVLARTLLEPLCFQLPGFVSSMCRGRRCLPQRNWLLARFVALSRPFCLDALEQYPKNLSSGLSHLPSFPLDLGSQRTRAPQRGGLEWT